MNYFLNKFFEKGILLEKIDWEEFNRWINQAKHTLNAIDADINAKNFDWACFKAHQAAEFSLKAILRGLSKPAFGNDLKKFVKELSEYISPPEDIIECVSSLNKLYIPSRYPDAFSEGSPFEFFTKKDSIEAKNCAKKILEWVDAIAKRIEETY